LPATPAAAAPSARRAPLLLAGAAAAPITFAALPPPARAQQAPAPTAEGGAIALPEIEVEAQRERATDRVRGYVARQSLTGSKTDTPILEIPQSVSVITRDQIDARQAQTLGQAMRYSAGVRVEQYGADWRYDWFTLRGFDAQTNSVFLDGLRYQFGGLIGMIEPYGLQRIEILRGLASALFGRNQPGGVVDLMQRRPTRTPQGEVRLGLGRPQNLTGAFPPAARSTPTAPGPTASRASAASPTPRWTSPRTTAPTSPRR
jgi:iron complex outermembrane recepter protein